MFSHCIFATFERGGGGTGSIANLGGTGYIDPYKRVGCVYLAYTRNSIQNFNQSENKAIYYCITRITQRLHYTCIGLDIIM